MEYCAIYRMMSAINIAFTSVCLTACNAREL